MTGTDDDGDRATGVAERPGLRLVGVRVSALVELLLFLAAALAIDHFLGAGDRFRATEPHPFWIIVLLLSVQYGTIEGLLAATAASVLILTGGVPPQQLGVDRFAYLFDVGFLPMSWFVAAVVLGELSGRHRRRLTETRRALREAEIRERRLASSLSRLKVAHDKLELVLASELYTDLAIHRAAGQLHGDSIEAILTGAAELLEAAMQPTKYSLYMLDRGKLRIEAREGWDDGDPFLTEIDSTHRLFEELVVARRVLCVAHEGDAAILGAEGLLAAPLLDEGRREVLGILKIEKMEFAALTFGAIETFKAIADLVGAAIEKLRRLDRLESGGVLDPRTMLYSESFFERQAAFLATLGRHAGFPVSALRVSLVNGGEAGHDLVRRFPAALRDAAAEVLRSTDLPFRRSDRENSYAIVLPATSETEAAKVASKLVQAIGAKLGRDRSFLDCRIEPLTPGEAMRPGEQMSQAAGEYAQQLRFLLALARRIGFDVCEIRLALALDGALPADVRAGLPERVEQMVRDAVPAPNLVYRETDSPSELVVVLPAASLDDARRLSIRLHDLVEDRFGRAFAALGLTARVAHVFESGRETKPGGRPEARRPRRPGAPRAVSGP